MVGSSISKFFFPFTNMSCLGLFAPPAGSGMLYRQHTNPSTDCSGPSHPTPWRRSGASRYVFQQCFLAKASEGWFGVTASKRVEPQYVLNNRVWQYLADDMHGINFMLLGCSTHHPHFSICMTKEMDEQQNFISISAYYFHPVELLLNSFLTVAYLM